ncbi:MAG: ABC-2 family transporter protein [Kofleriaceae bacterium]|nr:ABC-2 family transporter protein [Kofleriaceae bacterium]
MRRYLTLIGVQLRVSAMTAMQYRGDFVVQGLMSLYWLGWNLLPLLVLFDHRATVAGWDQPSALLVVAYFVLLRALIEGLVSPSLVDTVERIRTGSFDYVLLKPVDAQFLASTAKFEPWKIVDLLGGLTIAVIAFVQRGQAPAPLDLLAGLALLVAGALAVYGLWILAAAASFWVVKLDNLTYLLGAIFDTARWPVQVFRGAWRVIFTFVIPVAVMTTYPAMAVLGRLDLSTGLASAGGAAAVAVIAHLAWRAAIRNYTSASS